MKGWAYHRYGAPAEVLTLTDLPEPKIGPHTVLVDIRAAGVNPVDWQTMAGGLDSRFDIVLPVVPGWDFSGTVAAVGPSVRRFSVGDEVFGFAWADMIHHGTYAERLAVPDRLVALKPDGLDWTEAAAIPIAALTAYQALVDLLDVKATDTVLVQAAAGGVGSFAVQIATHLGATVLGTASPRNHASVAAAGATPIDYHGNLAAAVRAHAPDGVDAVLDMYGGADLHTHASLLVPTLQRPRIVSLADDGIRNIGGRFLFARPDVEQLARIGNLIVSGEIALPRLRIVPFGEAVQALEESAQGDSTGKTVMAVTGGR